jgi:hypothetical protein
MRRQCIEQQGPFSDHVTVPGRFMCPMVEERSSILINVQRSVPCSLPRLEPLSSLSAFGVDRMGQGRQGTEQSKRYDSM